MKNKPTPITDDFLQSVHGLSEAETDTFFYTRLKARMERENEQTVSLPLKPIWLVSLLAIILFINGFFLMQQAKQKVPAASKETVLQNFAGNYGLTISTSF